MRLTETSDRRAILEVVAAAFWRNDRNGQVEVGIVERTWKLGAAAEALEFIVVNHSVVLGHVLAARGRLGTARPSVWLRCRFCRPVSGKASVAP